MRTLPLALLLAASTAFARGHVHPSDSDSNVPAHQNHPVDPSVEKPTGKMVELPDAKSKAYLAEPQGKPKGAVLVVHEWWGLNDHVKHEADLLAKQGYEVLAVDLYDGKVASTPADAGKYMQDLKPERAGEIEGAGVKFLRHVAPDAKLATLGWCMGGGESLHASLVAAQQGAPVAGTVMYYGLPVDDVAQLKTLKGPLLGIWANKDGWITPDKVATFDKALSAAGVPHEFHAYDADHAFANPTGGKYNPPAAKDADAKRNAFLAKVLGK